MTVSLKHANAALFEAMAKAQGEIENASKNAANPHFRSKYADLAEVLNTIRPTFAANGLSLMQSTGFDGSLVSVTTVLSHKDGGYITSVASCVPAKTDAQGVGSSTTYLRRYSAAAMAGIAQEDDDGQAARHDSKPAPVQKVKPTDGAWEAMDDDQRGFLTGVAEEVKGRMSDPADAADYLSGQHLDSDEKVALWTLLDSKIRTPLTKALNELKKAKE